MCRARGSNLHKFKEAAAIVQVLAIARLGAGPVGTLIVDEPGTRALRDAHRARRLQHARPYTEFIDEWETRRPPDDALKYFGEWPSGALNRSVVRI